jgi:hypothetical protein
VRLWKEEREKDSTFATGVQTATFDFDADKKYASLTMARILIHFPPHKGTRPLRVASLMGRCYNNKHYVAIIL